VSKQLFDEVVGELPPSTVNTGAIVQREKRRRVNRAVSFATALVALSVTAGVTIGGMGGTSARPSAGPARPTQVTDTRFALAAYDDQSAAMTAKQLTRVFDEALHKEASNARWIFQPVYVGQPKGPDGVPPALEYKVRKGMPGKTGQMFFGISGVLNDGRKGTLHLAIVQSAVHLMPTGKVVNLLKCPPHGPKCIEAMGPDGEATVLVIDGDKPSAGNFVNYVVNVGLPGGRVLQLDHSNDFGNDGDPVPQPGTPLTSRQVMAIAIDIASHIKA
jgi:hypothetical protein